MEEMMRVEFENLTNTKVTNEQYAIIEEVYTYHPCINNLKGKQQIADLYTTFGMRVIQDMLPTATKAKEIEHQIQARKSELRALEDEMARLIKGI